MSTTIVTNDRLHYYDTKLKAFVAGNYATKGEMKPAYKPAGSVAFASLPTPSAAVLGNVYNVTTEFTTTSDFVEGAGKKYPAGTNVVVVDTDTTGSNPEYKFDAQAGMTDLTGYVKETDLVEITESEIDGWMS